MIHEHFRATGSYEPGQGLSDLFGKRLQNDDVQDFGVRWDEALLTASETLTEMILEGLYKSKLEDSAQPRLYWLCMIKRIFETTNSRATPD